MPANEVIVDLIKIDQNRQSCFLVIRKISQKKFLNIEKWRFSKIVGILAHGKGKEVELRVTIAEMTEENGSFSEI